MNFEGKCSIKLVTYRELEPSHNVSTVKQGSQNTAEPLLSSQLLFGCQRPKSRKKLSAVHCNENLYSTATSIKQPHRVSFLLSQG